MKIPSSRTFPRGTALAVCALAALIAAVASISSISFFPPHVASRHLDVAGASARAVVDRPRPLISDRLATSGDYQTLHKRAVLLANIATTPPALRFVAERAGLDAGQIDARTRVTGNVQAGLTEPNSERRAHDIAAAKKTYRLEIQPDPQVTVPRFNIYVQAPSLPAAQRLADAVVPGVRDYVREIGTRAGADPRLQLQITQLGPSRGAILNSGAQLQIAALTFLTVFVLLGMIGLVAARVRQGQPLSSLLHSGTAAADDGAQPPAARPDLPPSAAAAGRPRAERAPLSGHLLTPAVATAGVAAPAGSAPVLGMRTTARELRAVSRELATRAGNWPRTTRILPWMLAAMMAVVWLVPFNVIELSVDLPIDLKFDRLVLPFIVATWALVLAAGGTDAPRVRLTWIHIAIGGIIAVACLSVVVNAAQLNHMLEFDTAVKKLVLLMSYCSLFVIAASVVRREEVPAFLKYTLALAVICAIGTIWEYRFRYNVFYSLSDQILPSIFTVGDAESAAVDQIGRRIVRGPAELSLEAVAMMTMALPIALVGIMQSTRWRQRIWYALAASLLLAAAIATFRKSAFVAPVSVFLTLAYFRRRELIRLAPLGVVLLLMVHILSPGALGSVAAQLRGDRLNVATVSDRNADYDAVRPDIWTHLLIGRGYGGYEHTSYRILDMELLHQLIEIGVLGLAAYILLMCSVVATARVPIRSRSPGTAAAALAAAAAAAAFLVVSMLFDVMSFPHCPYILLWMAALLAATVSAPRAGDAGPEAERGAAWSS